MRTGWLCGKKKNSGENPLKGISVVTSSAQTTGEGTSEANFFLVNISSCYGKRLGGPPLSAHTFLCRVD